MKKQKGFGLLDLMLVTAVCALLCVAVVSGVDYADTRADAGDLQSWKTVHVTGPVANVALYTQTDSGGRFAGSSTTDWAYFTSGGYQVLNQQMGASALCPRLMLHGVDSARASKSAIQQQAALATSHVTMTLVVPRPSVKVSAKGCTGVVEKADHFEFGGRTVAFATDIVGLPQVQN